MTMKGYIVLSANQKYFEAVEMFWLGYMQEREKISGETSEPE